MLYRKILEELHRLRNQLYGIQAQIAALPDGKLICSRGRNCFKWYVSDGHTPIYLPKSKREMAEQLAYKKYLSIKADFLKKEIAALEFYLRHTPGEADHADMLLKEPSGFRELLLPHFKPKSQNQLDWMTAPYDRNMNYPEKLIHKTSVGINVRSKSEAMILTALHTNRIPFRYECALTLNGVTTYPDFTIMHPETSKIYYWEHFGRMDDSEYIQKTCTKLKSYSLHGIVPSVHLIMTFETQQYPLSQDEITKVVERYFL